MIEIKNLSFSYNKKEDVLKNIDLTINKGEWVAVLGHNGSGKSTLSKLLIGLQKPSSGEITVDGITLNEKTVNEIRKKIGIVFQNPDNQFVGVTVKHDIAFGLENRMIDREIMNDIILDKANVVSMQNYLEIEPHNLSGGQKQRVAIASVLAIDTDYIIFDEATSMLDPKGVEDVTNIIKEINKKTDKTIITITHNLNLAKYATKVVVLKDGEIVGCDKPDQIFKNRELLENTNLDSPFFLKAFLDAKNDEKLNSNKELVELLWELNSKM